MNQETPEFSNNSIRCWFDERDIGVTSKEYEFESAILLSTLLPTEISHNQLWNDITFNTVQKEMIPIQESQSNSENSPLFDQTQIMEDIFRDFHFPQPMTPVPSLASTFSLYSDLSVMLDINKYQSYEQLPKSKNQTTSRDLNLSTKAKRVVIPPDIEPRKKIGLEPAESSMNLNSTNRLGTEPRSIKLPSQPSSSLQSHSSTRNSKPTSSFSPESDHFNLPSPPPPQSKQPLLTPHPSKPSPPSVPLPLPQRKQTSSIPSSNIVPMEERPKKHNPPSTKQPPQSIDNNKYPTYSSAPPNSSTIEKSKAFLSAKQQFKQEGGKFDPQPPKSFVSPAANKITSSIHSSSSSSTSSSSSSSSSSDQPLPPELEHCDKLLVEKIEMEIIHQGQRVYFQDIAGLEFAKKCVQEVICWPMSRPDLFKGLRALPKGLLLFGPPGTGKTLIGKAISYEAGATFFNISASSLTSKWIGEGEKLVRTLFSVAAYRQPSVIFIDEVDSLLCARSSEENEASRRMKTEFLVQLDGAGRADQAEARVVVLGATNRPEELDEAARRRFVKRIYIPLPDPAGRRQLIQRLLEGGVEHELSAQDIEWLVERTEGFSGADIKNLCTEAAMGPLRELAFQSRGDLKHIDVQDVPLIRSDHFENALETVGSSVSPSDLERYIEWNKLFGSFKKQTT